MTPRALLACLQAADIEVAPANDNLRLRGPTGVLTPELLAMVREHKPALLKLLNARDGALADEHPPDFNRAACGHDDALVLFNIEGEGLICGKCWRRWVSGYIGWPGTNHDGEDRS